MARNVLLALVGIAVACATGSAPTFDVRFGGLVLAEPLMHFISEALPVNEGRTAIISLPGSGENAEQWETLAVAITPSRSYPYTLRVRWTLPDKPKYSIGWRVDEEPDGKWVLTGTQRGVRGPVTVPFAFDMGDPAGRWRLEVFINGTKMLDREIEISLGAAQ